jgi:hypothetical protein
MIWSKRDDCESGQKSNSYLLAHVLVEVVLDTCVLHGWGNVGSIEGSTCDEGDGESERALLVSVPVLYYIMWLAARVGH